MSLRCFLGYLTKTEDRTRDRSVSLPYTSPLPPQAKPSHLSALSSGNTGSIARAQPDDTKALFYVEMEKGCKKPSADVTLLGGGKTNSKRMGGWGFIRRLTI